MRRRHGGRSGASLAVVALLVLAGGTACGGSEETGNVDLTVFAASAPDGLRATLDAFEAETGIGVRLTASPDFARDIRERVVDGDVPDIALFPQPALLAELARGGDLVPLAPRVVAAAEVHFDEGVRRVGNVDGRQFGLLVSVNAKSLVWYSPDRFVENGFEVPATWDELLRLTAEMRRSGTTPWCFGTRTQGGVSGWPATDWIEDLVLHRSGAEVYDGWVAGEIPFDDPRIGAAFALFEEAVVAPGQARGGASTVLATLWDEASLPLLDSPPGCFLAHTPSFWRGSLPSGTMVGPGGDLNVFALPVVDAAVGSPVLVGGDTAASFTARDEAMALLEHLASPESVEPWAASGAYVAPHRDFDLEAYVDAFDRQVAGALAEASLLRFDGSDVMPVAVGEGSFRRGMEHFVRTRDVDGALRIIEAGYARDDGAP